MKKINTGFVVDPTIQQPFTTKSLDFLQDNSKEMIYAICRNLVTMSGRTYNTSTPYYIAQNQMGITISDGFVFFNDELYVMTENTGTLDYAIIDTTADATYDPLLFTDNVSRNVHNNRRLSFTSTLAGSLFAIADIVSVQTPVVANPVVANTSATITGITSTDYTIKFNSEISDVDGINNTTTGVITPTRSGVYSVSASVIVTGITALAVNFGLSLYKNGAFYRTLDTKLDTNFSPVMYLSGTLGVVCNGTTDNFEIRIGLDGAQTYNLYICNLVVSKIN